MANRETYVKQIDRLKSNFGERYFGKEKVEIFWAEVKYLNDADVERLTTDLIADCRGVPTRKDLRDKIAELRLVRHENQKKEASKYLGPSLAPEIAFKGMQFIGKVLSNSIPQESIDKFTTAIKAAQKTCKFCNSTGIIFAKSKNEKYDSFAFKCMCLAGKEAEENYPKWSSEFSEKYEIYF